MESLQEQDKVYAETKTKTKTYLELVNGAVDRAQANVVRSKRRLKKKVKI